MFPLGETIYLWRIDRGLTQDRLSRLTGVSRPNLSAIEQGARDITVQTLRRIARSLGIGPGLLVEGTPPSDGQTLLLDRESLDGIARYVIGQKIGLSDDKRQIAESLRELIKNKIAVQTGRKRRLERTGRKERQSLLRLKTRLKPAELKSLINRIEKLSSISHE